MIKNRHAHVVNRQVSSAPATLTRGASPSIRKQHMLFDRQMRKQLELAKEANRDSEVIIAVDDVEDVKHPLVIENLLELEKMAEELALNYKAVVDSSKEKEKKDKGYVFDGKKGMVEVELGQSVVPEDDEETIRNGKEIRGLLGLLQDNIDDILSRFNAFEDYDGADEYDIVEELVDHLKRQSMIQRSLVRFIARYSVPLAQLVERGFRNQVLLFEWLQNQNNSKRKFEVERVSSKQSQTRVENRQQTQKRLTDNDSSTSRPEEVYRLRREVDTLKYQLKALEESSVSKYRKLEAFILSKSKTKTSKQEMDSFLQKVDEVDNFLEDMEKETEHQVTILTTFTNMIADIDRAVHKRKGYEIVQHFSVDAQCQTLSEHELIQHMNVPKYFGYYIYPESYVKFLPKELPSGHSRSPASVINMITNIYKQKLVADNADLSSGLQTSTMALFIYQYFLQKHGLKSSAEHHLTLFFSDLHTYMDTVLNSHPRMNFFTALMGISKRCICRETFKGLCVCGSRPPHSVVMSQCCIVTYGHLIASPTRIAVPIGGPLEKFIRDRSKDDVPDTTSSLETKLEDAYLYEMVPTHEAIEIVTKTMQSHLSTEFVRSLIHKLIGMSDVLDERNRIEVFEADAEKRFSRFFLFYIIQKLLHFNPFNNRASLIDLFNEDEDVKGQYVNDNDFRRILSSSPYFLDVEELNLLMESAGFSEDQEIEVPVMNYEDWASSLKYQATFIKIDEIFIQISNAFATVEEDRNHKLTVLFKDHDSDGDGVLTLQEFSRLVESLDPSRPPRDILHMFQAALDYVAVHDPTGNPDSLSPAAFIHVALANKLLETHHRSPNSPTRGAHHHKAKLSRLGSQRDMGGDLKIRTGGGETPTGGGGKFFPTKSASTPSTPNHRKVSILESPHTPLSRKSSGLDFPSQVGRKSSALDSDHGTNQQGSIGSATDSPSPTSRKGNSMGAPKASFTKPKLAL